MSTRATRRTVMHARSDIFRGCYCICWFAWGLWGRLWEWASSIHLVLLLVKSKRRLLVLMSIPNLTESEVCDFLIDSTGLTSSVKAQIATLRREVAELKERLQVTEAKVAMWEECMQQMVHCVILSPDMNDMYKSECAQILKNVCLLVSTTCLF